MKTARKTSRKVEVASVNPVAYFATSKEAWAFMRECDAEGVVAGFPSLNDNDGLGYSVEYIAK